MKNTLKSYPILFVSLTLMCLSNVAFSKEQSSCSFISTPGSNNQLFDVGIASNDTIYALASAERSYASALCKSHDGGLSWESLNVEQNARILTVDANNYIYIGANNGLGKTLYKSVDGGESWVDISDPNTYDLESIDIDSYGQIFTANYGKYSDINISRDGGTTWEYIDQMDSQGIAIDFDDNVFSFSTSGFLKSINGGYMWEELPRPLSTVVLDAAFNANNHIFIGDRDWMSPEGLFRSIDGGSTWQNIFGENRYSIQSIAVDKNTDHLFVGVADQSQGSKPLLFNSMDNGETWFNVEIPHFDGYISKIAIDSKSHIYLGANEFYSANTNYFYKSEDGGNTWKALGNL